VGANPHTLMQAEVRRHRGRWRSTVEADRSCGRCRLGTDCQVLRPTQAGAHRLVFSGEDCGRGAGSWVAALVGLMHSLGPREVEVGRGRDYRCHLYDRGGGTREVRGGERPAPVALQWLVDSGDKCSSRGQGR
jgi:hypothetical protein